MTVNIFRDTRPRCRTSPGRAARRTRILAKHGRVDARRSKQRLYLNLEFSWCSALAVIALHTDGAAIHGRESLCGRRMTEIASGASQSV